MNEEENIHNNENRFGIPEGYFESFNQRLFMKLELEEELKDFPVLASLTKKQPFVTPDNYFDSVTENTITRIEQETGRTAKIISLPGFVQKFKYAIAAIFVLALGSAVFFKFFKTTETISTDTVCMELACLTKEEITSSKYFNQISLSELESVAGQEVQDSLKQTINKELINELIQNPDEIGLTDDDVEL